MAGKVFFATSDSSLYHVLEAVPGKPITRPESKAYMFSSPAVAGNVVLTGVLNGTLEARDLKPGELLWDYKIDKSKENKSWILTNERKFNAPLDLLLELARKPPRVVCETGFNLSRVTSPKNTE